MDNSVFIGEELKYAVTIAADGFDMQTDDFEIIVKCKSKKRVYKKSDLLYDEHGTFHIAIDTNFFPAGDLYAITYAYVPDDDFPDGRRTEVDQTWLTTLKKTK